MDIVPLAYSVIEAARVFCKFYRRLDAARFASLILPDNLATPTIAAFDGFCEAMAALEASDPNGFFIRENDGPSGKEDM